MEHTEGKWVVEISDRDREIYQLYVHEKEDVTWVGESDFANAQRIVACVNACEGIETEDLEAGEKSLHHDLFHVTAERDELINLLEEAINQRDELLRLVREINDYTDDPVLLRWTHDRNLSFLKYNAKTEGKD